MNPAVIFMRMLKALFNLFTFNKKKTQDQWWLDEQDPFVILEGDATVQLKPDKIYIHFDPPVVNYYYTDSGGKIHRWFKDGDILTTRKVGEIELAIDIKSEYHKHKEFDRLIYKVGECVYYRSGSNERLLFSGVEINR